MVNGQGNLDSPLTTRWRKQYEAALGESDSGKLASLIVAAEDAIFTRLQQLDRKHDPARDWIAAAIPKLRRLQAEKLNFLPLDGEA